MYGSHVALGTAIGVLAASPVVDALGKTPAPTILAAGAVIGAAVLWLAAAGSLLRCYQQSGETEKAEKLQKQIDDLNNKIKELQKWKDAHSG